MSSQEVEGSPGAYDLGPLSVEFAVEGYLVRNFGLLSVAASRVDSPHAMVKSKKVEFAEVVWDRAARCYRWPDLEVRQVPGKGRGLFWRGDHRSCIPYFGELVSKEPRDASYTVEIPREMRFLSDRSFVDAHPSIFPSKDNVPFFGLGIAAHVNEPSPGEQINAVFVSEGWVEDLQPRMFRRKRGRDTRSAMVPVYMAIPSPTGQVLILPVFVMLKPVTVTPTQNGESMEILTAYSLDRCRQRRVAQGPFQYATGLDQRSLRIIEETPVNEYQDLPVRVRVRQEKPIP